MKRGLDGRPRRWCGFENTQRQIESEDLRLAVLRPPRAVPLDAEASRLRVRLEKVKLAPPYDIEGTFAALKAQRVDAVLAVGDPVVYRELVRIAKAGVEQGLAVVGGFPTVEVGFLMGFGPDLNAALRSGAEYVDRILRGAKAAEMPIEQPTKFELVINLKTAKALGLTIPPSLLQRADQVIE